MSVIVENEETLMINPILQHLLRSVHLITQCKTNLHWLHIHQLKFQLNPCSLQTQAIIEFHVQI